MENDIKDEIRNNMNELKELIHSNMSDLEKIKAEFIRRDKRKLNLIKSKIKDSNFFGKTELTSFDIDWVIDQAEHGIDNQYK